MIKELFSKKIVLQIKNSCYAVIKRIKNPFVFCNFVIKENTKHLNKTIQ